MLPCLWRIYIQRPGSPGWRLDEGLTTIPFKKIVEKPSRNSAGFWAVEPRKEERSISFPRHK